MEAWSRTRKWKKDAAVLFYLQLGQSPQAMLRDLPLLEFAHRKKWPIVLHVHGGSFRVAYDRAPGLLRILVKRALNRADKIIVLSESLKVMFDGLVDDNKLAVVANGAEQSLVKYARKLKPKPESAEGMRVLFVSNLIKSKGYQTVLEAALLAQQQKLPLHFVLAGHITETTTVHPDVFIEQHNLKNVEFLGPVHGQEKLGLFENADIFVLPISFETEGQPISIIEAMHFGLPVITTRKGGIPDIVKDRENGLIIDPKSPIQLVDALKDMLVNKELRRAISLHNSREAQELYTAEVHGKTMCDLFESI
ncbi:glycosyltransferase involved in cell wall biosynthesis [Bradymonas sediminis]|nr:glycosyltransferase involved in cell wall biosynthesis [Bradymonas sediminis]